MEVAALGFAALIGVGLATWVISPRFDIGGPSLIDDWHSILSAPEAWHNLRSLSLDPTPFDPDRFRPAWWAIWNQLQWHTFGGPLFMRGPNAWNAVREGLLVSSLALLVIVAIPRPRRRSIGVGWLTALAVAPALVILSIPNWGIDLARLAPQEPMLVAAMAVGGVLLVGGLAAHHRSRFHIGAVIAVILVGEFLWAVGVYHKEASVCVLVLVPFLALELRRRWREDGGPVWRRRPIAIVSVLAVLPLLHVGYEVLQLLSKGTLVYGAASPQGLSGWWERIQTSFHTQWDGIAGNLGGTTLKILLLLAPVAVIEIIAWRRRVPWLAAGFVVLAWALLIFQGATGVTTSRYYLPVAAMLLVALACLAAEYPRSIRVVALAAVTLFAYHTIPDTHRTVEAFAASEQAEQRAVAAVASLNPAECPVYLATIDLERKVALATLLDLRPRREGGCMVGFEATLSVWGGVSGSTVQDERIREVCVDPGWRVLNDLGVSQVLGCNRLKRGSVKFSDGSSAAVDDILKTDRLVLPSP